MKERLPCSPCHSIFPYFQSDCQEKCIPHATIPAASQTSPSPEKERNRRKKGRGLGKEIWGEGQRKKKENKYARTPLRTLMAEFLQPNGHWPTVREYPQAGLVASSVQVELLLQVLWFLIPRTDIIAPGTTVRQRKYTDL